ncbi:hypothetical protein LCGC14_2238220, partial [marine sediment metagenome]
MGASSVMLFLTMFANGALLTVIVCGDSLRSASEVPTHCLYVTVCSAMSPPESVLT